MGVYVQCGVSQQNLLRVGPVFLLQPYTAGAYETLTPHSHSCFYVNLTSSVFPEVSPTVC